MKLRYKLNLLIIGLIILSISIPSVIYYYFSKEMIKKEVDGYLQSELSRNVYEFYAWLDTQSQTVIVISDVIRNNFDKSRITGKLLQSYCSNKNISDIYIGFNDGSFISGIGWTPEEGYDPRKRPWYQEVMDAGELNISNVYYDFTSKQYAVAIGIPLKDKSGEIIGVLSEDILLNTFYEKIQKIRLGNGGYAYLMDTDGNILVHYDQDLVGENYNKLIDGGMKINLPEKKSGEFRYLYKGNRRLAVYDAIRGTSWLLVLVVEEAKIYAPLSRLLWIYFMVVAASILFGTFLTGIFNQNIIRRLKLLSNASAAISEGRFDIEISGLGNDEIGDVSDAFNRMKTEISEKISELDSSKAKYEEVIENTADAIYSVNADGYLVTANTVFLDLFQISRDTVGNELLENLIKHSELGVILLLLGREVLEKKQLINRKIDNIENHYYNVTLSPILDENSEQVKGITSILHDVSDLEASRNHLEWVSHHDALTQLPNRFQFMEDMDTVILKAESGHYQFAVLFIDLDDFKSINDTLGYASGDLVLQTVAAILRESYTAYRIGADEFVVVLDAFETLEELYRTVDDISRMLHRSIELDLNTVYSSATIGVAIYPQDFVDVNEMMIRADAALNYAKRNKKSEVQYYECAISQKLEQQVILEKGLRKALDRKEFLLYYQPIMNSTTGKIKGFEALIRWRNSEGKMISPGEFMPVAENMALIHTIGLWVIQQALHDLKKFQGISNQNFTMAINLSANQLKQSDFCDKVMKIIETTGIDPHNIELEITETVLIESLELMKKQFQPLVDSGIRISLDDFGTGYSSLNYIQNFPFHILKIDKSFIDYIRKDTVSRSLVNHIIDIAHGMDMEIVAEGVENEIQKEYLIERKCDYLQGYLLSRPIPPEEVCRFIAECL